MTFHATNKQLTFIETLLRDREPSNVKMAQNANAALAGTLYQLGIREASDTITMLLASPKRAVYATPAPAAAPVTDDADFPSLSAPVAPVTSTAIPNATFTVVMGDGSHVTLKLTTAPEKFGANKQIASYLMGPDNTSDFKGFAFVDSTRRANIWKAFKTADRLIEALDVLLHGEETPLDAVKRYALISGRCGVCGRELTVPESIEAGIGPVCLAKFG